MLHLAFVLVTGIYGARLHSVDERYIMLYTIWCKAESPTHEEPTMTRPATARQINALNHAASADVLHGLYYDPPAGTTPRWASLSSPRGARACYSTRSTPSPHTRQKGTPQ